MSTQLISNSMEQCPLNCNDLIHISLAQNCMRSISPRDVMNGDTSCMDALEVQIQYKGSWIGNQVGPQHIGKKLKYRVINPIDNNSCWGEILVSKKTKPIVNLDTLTLDCLDPIPGPSDLFDSCGFRLTGQVLSTTYTDLNCSGTGTLIGRVHRTLLVIDPWNNSTQADQVINLIRSDLSDLNCPSYKYFECCTPVNGKSIWDPKYSDFDASGYAHPKPILDDYGNSIGLVDPPYRIVDGKKMYLWDFKGKCKIAIHYKDHVIAQCGWSYTIKRHWQIEDWCSGDEWECYQEIIIEDKKGPEVETLKDITLKSSDYACETHYIAKRPELIKECGFDGSQADLAHFHKKLEVHFHIKEDGQYYYGNGKIIKEGYLGYEEEIKVKLKPGTYKVQYEISDACHNYTVISHKITVKDDSYAVPQCISSMEVDMGYDCSKKVYATQMDKGSHHTCCGKVHYAVAIKDSVDYYSKYWKEHFRSNMSSSQYQRYSIDINHAIEEWINTYIFDDYVEMSHCGSNKVMFRVYEACDMDPYPNWFPGNKHQWYNYQSVKDYDCYFVSHYPYIKQGAHGHYPPMKYGTNSPKVDHCYKFDSGTYSWLSTQGVSSGMISTLRKMENDAPLNYLSVKYADCSVSMYTTSHHSMSCETPEDLNYYCDGTPKQTTLNIDANTVYLSNTQFAESVNCENPETDWSSSGPTFGNYNGTAFQDPDCVNNWQPVYCRSWLLLDDNDHSQDLNNYFGDIQYGESCGTVDLTDHIISDLDICGNGTITKTWTIEDECGNKTSCSQKIHVSHRSDFEAIFPEDLAIQDSMLSVTDLGTPEISDADCENIEIEYIDLIIDSTSAGYIIERTWTVTNTCLDMELSGPDIIVDDKKYASDERSCVMRHLKDNGDGQIYYVQWIQVKSQAVVNIICPDDMESCADESTCSSYITLDSIIRMDGLGDLDSVSFQINGGMVISGNSLDQELPIGLNEIEVMAYLNSSDVKTCQFTVEVIECKDLTLLCESLIEVCGNSDCTSDSLDIELGSISQSCLQEDQIEFQYILKPFQSDDPQEWILGSGNRLQGKYPIGLHEIQLFVLDNQGNVDSCAIDFLVKDCSGLSIEYFGDSIYCNQPGMCFSDTLDISWVVKRACSEMTDNSSLSYLFVIKPDQSENSGDWIILSENAFTGILPVGTHRLEMIVIDPYGPADTMTMDLTIANCDSMIFECIDSVLIFEVTDTNAIQVTTEQFIHTDFMDCGDAMYYSFSPDSLLESLQYACSDIEENDTLYNYIYISSVEQMIDSCLIGYRFVDLMGDDCGTGVTLKDMPDKMFDDLNRSKSSIRNEIQVESLFSLNRPSLHQILNSRQFSIFPNPFSTEFQVIYTGVSESEATIEIFSLSGNLIYRNTKQSTLGRIGFRVNSQDFFESGIYIVKLKTTEHQITRRISYIK